MITTNAIRMTSRREKTRPIRKERALKNALALYISPSPFYRYTIHVHAFVNSTLCKTWYCFREQLHYETVTKNYSSNLLVDHEWGSLRALILLGRHHSVWVQLSLFLEIAHNLLSRSASYMHDLCTPNYARRPRTAWRERRLYILCYIYIHMYQTKTAHAKLTRHALFFVRSRKLIPTNYSRMWWGTIIESFQQWKGNVQELHRITKQSTNSK